MFCLTSGISFALYFHNKHRITGFSLTYLMPVQGAVPKRSSHLPAAGYNYPCWNLGKAKEKIGIKKWQTKAVLQWFPKSRSGPVPSLFHPTCCCIKSTLSRKEGRGSNHTQASSSFSPQPMQEAFLGIGWWDLGAILPWFSCEKCHSWESELWGKNMYL